MAGFQTPALLHLHRHHHTPSTPRLPCIRMQYTVGALIDLSRLHGDRTSRSLNVTEIGKACHEKGFFHVVNHGIPRSVTDGALRLASSFFDLPTEEKIEISSDDITRPVRYSCITDTAHLQRFFLKHYAHPLEQWVGQWPSKPAEYRGVMGRYSIEVRKVALQVMEAIMESLGLGRAYLKEELEQGLQLIANNGYPAHQKPNTVSGIPPHTDYSIITVLLQSSRGLEEWDGENGTWNLVQSLPGSLLVQVGNYLEVMSNGRYKGVYHRVRMKPGRRRVSIASLHSISMDQKIRVAEELVDEEHPKGYRESNFRELLEFLSTTKAVLGEGRNFMDTLKIAPGFEEGA